MKRIVSTLLLVLSSSLCAASNMYQCETAAGGTRFTDKPCNAGEKASIVKPIDSKVSKATQGSKPGANRLSMIARCERKWPADYQMQKYCTDQQTKAVTDLHAKMTDLKRSPGSPLIPVINGCMEKWKEGDTYDFQMVAYCYAQQSKGLAAMRREKGE